MSDGDITIFGNGFLSLLTILFIGLKLTGYIDWDWLWVLSPILIPISLLVILLIIYIIKVILFD